MRSIGMIYTCIIETPLGTMRAAAGEKALTGLWFTGQRYFPRRTEDWIEAPESPVFAALRSWLTGYFNGKKPGSNIPLAPWGTDFQQSVWKLLLKIPYGKTSTYGDLAGRLNRPMAAQAVGGAVGHNPISLLIPCHRVLGADGGLTGYAGGIEKKRALLELEGDQQEAL
jgi:methylated-DNA-[protein]-cysteine S-methyltransferase